MSMISMNRIFAPSAMQVNWMLWVAQCSRLSVSTTSSVSLPVRTALLYRFTDSSRLSR